MRGYFMAKNSFVAEVTLTHFIVQGTDIFQGRSWFSSKDEGGNFGQAWLKNGMSDILTMKHFLSPLDFVLFDEMEFS